LIAGARVQQKCGEVELVEHGAWGMDDWLGCGVPTALRTARELAVF
jgi:hypothetical protein